MKAILKYRIQKTVPNVILLILLPALTLVCTECYTHVPWDLSVPIFFLNLLFYYLLFWICTFLFGSTGAGYAVAPLLPMLFGLINYFVVDFRSSPVVPWDLYSLNTAMSVAGNYEYEITARVVFVTLGFLAISLAGSRTGIRIKPAGRRLVCLLAMIAGMGIYVKGLGMETVIDAAGLDTTLFTPKVLYRNNGLAVGFLGNLKYMKVEKPQGYSPQTAAEIAEEYPAESEAGGVDFPNVIVIMNEAFSDLSVFGEFETDYDYMPFIRSLEENTVKGNLYVSVKGGNTANTEYEFLTGDTMAFLPAGSVPYQQFIKGDMSSMASCLKELGYQTTAIHPYNASGWARDKVYPWLGFDTTLFKSDFEDPLLIRNYISDYSAFSKIIELYEAKDAKTPMFVFEVTMQNHGGYSKDVEGFEETVHLTELTRKTTSVRAAEKYLTLMLETDRAFEMLFNYFQDQEEDTVILMFGDHQPSDYITNTILRLLDLDRETSEDVYFDNYIVPFVMWANFEIEEEQVEAISPNYLGGLLFEKADIPLTGYQKFLQKLRADIPALTANMLMTAEKERYRYEEAPAAATDLLNDYRILDYNHLADRNHCLEKFF
ncbi:MAG: LTA synthase family protein [Eubacteriales bacterium]|nr:LTA synthase family protein [Eubacteriales bacterium]